MQLFTTCLVIAASCFLLACNEQAPAPIKSSEALPLLTFTANYRSGNTDWKHFLQCWREHVNNRLNLGRGYSGLKLLPPNMNVVPLGKSVVESQAIIKKYEEKLGVKLPASYKHFIEATNNQGWYIESSTAPASRVTLLPLDEIGPYPDKDPKNLEYWKRSDPSSRPIDIHRYVRYGYHPDPMKRQDPAYFEVSQLETLLLIGAFEGGGAILLNPKIVSTDGEFETWVLDFKTFAWRYRSFAEMMQNVAYFDIALEDARSPLSEEGVLSHSPCTSLLSTAAN